MKTVLFCVIQVVVFASVVSTEGCHKGVCVQQKDCHDNRIKYTGADKCQLKSNAAGVCCKLSSIKVGKNCILTTIERKKYKGKCVPESSCSPFRTRTSENIWKTRNEDCSEGRSKVNLFCCPENVLIELDSSKFIEPVKSEKPKDDNVVKRNRAIESQKLVQNVFPSCWTPENQNGHCVPLQLCDHLNGRKLNVLNKYKCPSKTAGSTSICCANPTNSSSFIRHEKAAKLGLAKCGPTPMGDKVLAGKKAGLGQYPWMANLMYKNNATHLEPKCGGSLIHPKYVLTAAHCRRGDNRPVAVRLGEYDLSKKIDCEERECAEPFKEYSVHKFTAHNKYSHRSQDYDIALIKLKTEVTLVPGQIFPICLPLTASLLMLKPKKLTVTGWGLTESGKISDVLLKADLGHVEHNYDDCIRKDSTFCVRGAKMEGSCQGDSGGPLQTIVPFGNTYRTVLFGIVSRGARKCSVNLDIPGVVELVSYHIHWILDNMDI